MKGNKIIGMVVLVVAILCISFIAGCDKFTAVDSAPTTTTTTPAKFSSCGDAKTTSFKLLVSNIMNETGNELYNMTVYVLTTSGSKVATITDTTESTAVTLDCGYTYVLKGVASDGASGDNSEFVGISSKPQNSDVKLIDGGIQFVADRPNFLMEAKAKQHATLEFKLYDKNDARFAYDTGDTGNTDFETTGVKYTDGDNSTAFALTSDSDFLDLRLDFKAVQGDTDFQDKYVLVGVVADIDKLQEPQMTFNGATLQDISDVDGVLNAQETKALNGYDYVYKITAPIEDRVQSLGIFIGVLSGQNPTADVEVDFFTAGNYLATAGNEVKTGTHKDDSSRSAVFTVQAVDIDVS